MTLEEYADASDNLVKILQEENATIKKQNKKLQAENTQLKEINNNTLAELNRINGELIIENANKDRQLKEAKEIIREYVNWDYGDHTNCLPDITKKAEAFIKE